MTEPEAAVALLHASGPEQSVLLIRRSERDTDSWSGHWSLPGGRCSSEDRDLLDTALRELEEECAIRLSRGCMERALPHMIARRKVGRFIAVAPFLFRVDTELPAVPHPLEAVEARWIPLSTIRDPRQHSLRTVPRWPEEMLFPAIDLNGVPLWGFTYRLLTIWLDLVPGHFAVDRGAFELGSAVLDFLISNGLTLQHGWADPDARHTGSGEQVIKVAAVKGRIPVKAVLDHFSKPAPYIPRVNCLEARSNCIRVVSLAFDQYLIQASG